jgi:hypothetical protein
MKYMTIALMGMIATTASADHLPFIDKDFDLFLKRMVPSSVRAQFTKKYKDFQENSKKLAAAERVKRNYDLFEKALDSLEVEHKAWAEDITAFLSDLRFLDAAYDAERVVVRDFLERYGLFKEFSKEASVHITVAKQSKTKKAWKSVKTQLAQASHKVGDWFKSLKSNATA